MIRGYIPISAVHTSALSGILFDYVEQCIRNHDTAMASPGPISMPRSPSGLIWRRAELKRESCCKGAEGLGPRVGRFIL